MVKRIVLEHVYGRLAGLQQILGTEDQLLRGPEGTAPLPTFIPDANFGDHVGPINLIAAKRSYHLYREVITLPTETKTFHADQR